MMIINILRIEWTWINIYGHARMWKTGAFRIFEQQMIRQACIFFSFSGQFKK